MSAPRYNSNNYDTAAQKYSALADKYTGANGQKKAMEAGSVEAKSASEQAGTSAYNQAVSQGYSRSKAARKAAEASAQAFQDSYNTGYNNAYNSNQNALAANGNLLTGAQQKDANKYTSDSNAYSAKLGAIGGAVAGIGSALSDENMKDIHNETDVEARRCELLKRLRG